MKIPNDNDLPWQKLGLSLLGISIVVGIWQWATWHLYSLPDGAITAFTSITNNCFYAISMLVFFFVTGKVLVDWKNMSTTAVSQVAQTIKEDINEKQTVDETMREFATPELQERYGDQ